ncbi:MAG: MarR family transcriptional regulator [Lysobacterales bacterium]|jgi:DNA-binding MarR family transcriptional regulator
MTNKAKTAIAKLEQTSRRKMALRIWLRILTSSQLIEKEVRSRFRTEFDTTLPRFDVMAALAREPKGQTMGDLSRWLLVSSGNITGIISRLQADGLVTRKRDPADHRTYMVKLSRRGCEEFERLSSAHERWVKDLLSDMKKEEMAVLDELLQKVKLSLARAESP